MAQVSNPRTPSPARDLYARLSRKLGVRVVHSDSELVRLVEKRLPAESVAALINGGLSSGEAYDLIVPRRTLTHRLARQESLSFEESDKAVRVARITAMAEQVFGEAARAWRWLRKPKQTFRGRTPLDLLATEVGARLVEQMLMQIDDGLAA